MVQIDKVVNAVRDDLKTQYLRDRDSVWRHPFVAIIDRNGPGFISGASSAEAIVDWLRSKRASGEILGVVIGRMVVKYGDARDSNGDPIVTERAILVSGRMLTTGQTYISITPCREHKDLRSPMGDSDANAEPKPGLPYIPGITSPDKVDKIVSDNGHVVGFLSMQFGQEQVFDSRKGDVCVLDPIIQGVVETPGAANA